MDKRGYKAKKSDRRDKPIKECELFGPFDLRMAKCKDVWLSIVFVVGVTEH
jgi:hypothetical protein